jgi:hypothetical protein
MLSADAIIPGSGSGQSAYWSPDTRVPAGYSGKWFMYFQTSLALRWASSPSPGSRGS